MSYVTQPQISQEQKEKASRLKAIASTLLNSDNGKELLEHLKSRTLDKPVFSSGVEAGKQATHAAYRQGQNDIVTSLIKLTE